jgi:hypothetical protein
MAPAPGGDLRRPLFVAAVVLAAVVVLAELGMSFLVGGDPVGAIPADVATSLGVDADVVAEANLSGSAPPGSGIAALALLDGLLLFTLLLLGTSLVVSHRTYGRVQGVATLVVTFLWILGGIVLAILAFVQLLLMIGLFVAVPFGTLAYLAIWGFFPVGDAALVLGLLLLLKLLMAGFLVASQPRFLRVKGLVALIAVSFLLQLVLGFIHGFLPRPVVAIGDQFWALVTAIVAIVWALIMLIVSIPAIVNAIRVSRSLAE